MYWHMMMAAPAVAAPYDPVAALFGAGEVGGLWRPGQTGGLFTDAARTTPTAVGGRVGSCADLSGNGWHLTNAQGTTRPIYELDADGVPNVRVAVSTSERLLIEGRSITTDFIFVALVLQQPTATYQTYIEGSRTPRQNDGFNWGTQANTANMHASVWRGSFDSEINAGIARPATPCVITTRKTGGHVEAWVNNTLLGEKSGSAFPANPLVAFSIGGHYGGSGRPGRFYAGLLRVATTSETQRDDAIAWMQGLVA